MKQVVRAQNEYHVSLLLNSTEGETYLFLFDIDSPKHRTLKAVEKLNEVVPANNLTLHMTNYNNTRKTISIVTPKSI